jgi:predicted Zn-dependent protease
MKILDPAMLALPKLQLAVRKTSLHEIGHFLGLHHQFNPAIPSIMSYAEKNESKLYDYDVKAVQHLYED